MQDTINKNGLNKIAYYPGCSLNSTAIDFNISLKKLLDILDIGYIEIDDWNCCGTTPAQNVSSELVYTLSARNLILAKKMGIQEILCPCVSCYNKLYKAAYYINTASKLKNKKEEQMRDTIIANLKDMGFNVEEELNFKVYSVIEFLYLKKKIIGEKYNEINAGRENLPANRVLLEKLKPVCYYGCALLRPDSALRFDDFEKPTSMEEILEEAGIVCKNFQFKTECCGAILSLTHKNAVLKLSNMILDSALESDANCLVVFCPLCQQNLDLRQDQINKLYKKNYHLPVFYITQLLGIALGLTPRSVMLDRLFVSPEFIKND
ncbi:MAG: hypothetical protein FJW68_00910 [Actinobacteria bacterium]|nr:hypothetical protein [Actinomycetota bacterium]